jgi:Flp pilus assembly protein TadG
MRAPTHSSRGQTLVEFALVSTLFFGMFIGIFEVARYVYSANAVTSGAHEGARWAIAVNNAPSGQTDACDSTLAGLQSAVRRSAQGLTVTITTTRDPSAVSQWCQVNVVSRFVPVGGAFPLPTFDVSSRSRQYYN